MKKIKLLILTIIIISLPLFGFRCSFWQSSDVDELNKPIELNWWGVWEDSSEVQTLIEAYQKVHPNVTIKYRKFRYDEYEAELTRAWLEKRGPDIFSISSNWLGKYKDLIKPMPDMMRLPFIELQGTVKKEPVTVIKNIPGLTIKKVEETFVDAVADQVIIEENIYGLPLHLDTLALYYNRDLLNSAKIPLPATTWSELVEQVPQLATFDAAGNIKQSAIALGTTENVPRASDIVALLMMQNGASMIDNKGYTTFNQPAPNQNDFYPAASAIDFYTSFSNANKETYTWNSDMPDALTLFTSGKLAYFIGYAYQMPIIKAQSPKLNFNVAPMLQTLPDVQETNFADFWVLTTYMGTAEENTDPAWDFIRFITTDPELLKPYLEKTTRPTALRALINDQIQLDSLGVFADQLLNARNWYRGAEPEIAEQAMLEMIKQARTDLNSDFTIEDVLNIAVRKINQTINK